MRRNTPTGWGGRYAAPLGNRAGSPSTNRNGTISANIWRSSAITPSSISVGRNGSSRAMCAPGTASATSGTGSTSEVSNDAGGASATGGTRSRSDPVGTWVDAWPAVTITLMPPGPDEHASGRSDDRSRLRLVLLVTLSVAVVELVGAFLSGSLALFADAGHMLTDSAAIMLALSASYVATLPASPLRTFGYHRAEILAALINAVVLLGVCGYLAYAGVTRLLVPLDVDAAADARLRSRGPGRQRRLDGPARVPARRVTEHARRLPRGAR